MYIIHLNETLNRTKDSHHIKHTQESMEKYCKKSLPRNKNCIIVVGNPIFWNGVSIILVRENGFLPFTEAVKRLVCVVVYLQVGLQYNMHTRNVPNKLLRLDVKMFED